MPRYPRPSGLKDFEERLRAEGKLPRSMREVAAEFRRSGKILPPYDQKTDEQPQPVADKRTKDKSVALTPVEYSGLQEAFDHFNRTLFDNSIPDCFISYQRKANSAGSFCPAEFSGRVGKLTRDGIRLNPDWFIDKTDAQILQNLVHQMCHAWQHNHGSPSANGYHNAEWADKIKAIGLQPTSTGGVGGKETGARIFDYVIPSGAFEQTCEKLFSNGWRLNLQSAPREGKKRGPAKGKTPFTCASCEQNVWGKPDSGIDCHDCLIAAFPELRGKIAPFKMRPRSYETKPTAVEAPSYEITQPVKRKPGRPKGSKNKPQAPAPVIASYEQAKRKRGRPKGSKN
jgi:predicted SprT family Zn-dependent metalloprotease